MFKLVLLALVAVACIATPLEKEIVTSTVAFTIDINGETVGDIEIGLFGEVVPKTAENFR